jgi:hypothetical protein
LFRRCFSGSYNEAGADAKGVKQQFLVRTPLLAANLLRRVHSCEGIFMQAPNRTTYRYLVIPAAIFGMTLAGQALAQSPVDPMPTGATRVIDGMSEANTPVLEVPAKVQHKAAPRPRLMAQLHRHPHGPGLARPALAGVVLVEPVPGPFKGPQRPVIAPAYLFDSLAADFTTPPPPLVCEHRPREPGLPNPHLYREVPVACHYDID